MKQNSIKRPLIDKINLFAIILILGIISVSCSGDMYIEKDLLPATSETDMLLLRNPNRGFRMEVVVKVGNTTVNDARSADLCDLYAITPSFEHFLAYYAPESPVLAQLYFYLSKYNETPVIPEDGIRTIENNLSFARQHKIKLLLRFAYQSDEFTEDEASQEIMMGHIRQLKPLVEKYQDVIFAMQSGFLGAFGEWHSYRKEIDKLALLNAIFDMLPAGKYFQVRLPAYKNVIPLTDPRFRLIGYHIDSVFGEENMGNGGADPGTDSWKQITTESPWTPTDGELFWGRWTVRVGCWGNIENKGKIVDGFKVITQLSEHRFVTLSLHHNYREDDGLYGKYSMQYWQETEMTPAWLDEHRIFYAPGWFQDVNGNTVKRTVFDYVRDYLGYNGTYFLSVQ